MKKFSDFGSKRIKRINENQGTVISDSTLPKNIDIIDDEIAGTVEQSDVSKFFSKLFESKEMAHVYHLQVRGDEGSYAKHMALGGYYDGIIDMIDSVIEVYQGQYGLVDGYDIIDTSVTKSKDPVAYFEEVAEYIKHSRKCISEEDTHLHSIIDDIVCLLYQTLYKLKFNK